MDLPQLPRSAKRRAELVSDARVRTKVLNSLLEEAEDTLSALLIALVVDVLSEYHDPEEIEIGSWPCPESPIEVCAYNYEADPCRDSCLFCKQPSERK